MSRRSRARQAAFPHGSESLRIPDGGPTPAWSSRLIANGGPDVPEYGSPAWHELDDNDPRRVAATVAAAEAWRRANDPDVIADRLRLELAAARHVAEAEAAEAAALASRNIAEGVAARAGRPSYAQLCDLRHEPDRAAHAREVEARRGLHVSPPPQAGVPDPLPAHRPPVQSPGWPRVAAPVVGAGR